MPHYNVVASESQSPSPQQTIDLVYCLGYDDGLSFALTVDEPGHIWFAYKYRAISPKEAAFWLARAWNETGLTFRVQNWAHPDEPARFFRSFRENGHIEVRNL